MGKEAKIGLAVILILSITFGVVLARRLSGPVEGPQVSSSAENTEGTSETKTPEADFSKPTVLAAKPVSGSTTLDAGDGTAKVSPPSYMPNTPTPVSSEPFSVRTSQLPDVDGPVDQAPSAPGVIEPTDRKWQQSGESDDSYARAEEYSSDRSTIQQVPTYRQSARYTYQVEPKPPNPVGQYTISKAGFNASPQFGAAGAGLEDGEYRVQPNDSYWVISQKLYGCGAYFNALAEHNRDRTTREDRLEVGQVISAPSIAQLEKTYPGLCPKVSRRETVRRRASAVSTRSQYTGGRTYVVEEGDNLFNIARYELGKASRWVEIYQLNRDLLGEDYDYLTPGLQLVLPDGESADTVTRRPGTSSVY